MCCVLVFGVYPRFWYTAFKRSRYGSYNDLHDVEVPSGATYFGYKCDSPNDAEYNGQLITGIDAVWDPVKQKWFKVVDDVDVVVTKDGKIFTFPQSEFAR